MNHDISESDPLDDLAEEFMERYRRGEQPTVSEFTTRCPQRAKEIRDLFPTLVVLEELKPRNGIAPEANLADCANHRQRST